MKQNRQLSFSLALVGLVTPAFAELVTWEPSDYVQEGLVAMYDGIRNAGASLPHDSNVTVWTDISISGDAADLVIDNGGHPGKWTENGYLFDGSSYFQTRATPALGLNMTVQLATDALMPAPKNESFLAFDGAGLRCIYFWKGKSHCCSVTKDYTGVNMNGLPNWPGTYWNGAMDPEVVQMTFQDDFTGASRCAVSRQEFAEVPSGHWTIGGQSNDSTWGATGVVHAVRIYSRKLTDDELARNRMVDEARFHGSMIGQLPVTNVFVGASVAGISGTEKPGPYRVAGAHTFTASDCIVDGTSYVVAGYVLRLWNAEACEWGVPAEYPGKSFTWTDGMPMARLTWKWSVASGLRSVDTFDVEDYVQDGLVAMYDGIRNVSGSGATDRSATVWADISGSGDSADLVVDNAAAPGNWTENGYQFDGSSYFQTRATPALGLNMTVQLATDALMPAPKNESFLAFDGAGLRCIYFWKGKSHCCSVTKDYTGVNMNGLPDWPGTYWNGAMDPEVVQMTFQANFSSAGRCAVSRNAFVEVPSGHWTIGGQSNDSTWGASGVVHAVRIYSRKLTDDELQKNRMVDEARFHGRLTETNVVVATSNNGLTGIEPAGAYFVEGEWTFRAEERTVGEGPDAVRYSPKGYTIEKLVKGEWSDRQDFTGASYVHEASKNNTPVRLVWRWKSDKGLMLIFR